MPTRTVPCSPLTPKTRQLGVERHEKGEQRLARPSAERHVEKISSLDLLKEGALPRRQLDTEDARVVTRCLLLADVHNETG